jgi:hypothetical protein
VFICEESVWSGWKSLSTALMFAKLWGEWRGRTDLLWITLTKSYELHTHQENYDEALIFAEEAYNCVAIATIRIPWGAKCCQYAHPDVSSYGVTLIKPRHLLRWHWIAKSREQLDQQSRNGSRKGYIMIWGRLLNKGVWKLKCW